MNVSIQAIKQRFGIIGMSASLDHALSTAVRVAPTELSVLIAGESGVGKEAFSKIIHATESPKTQYLHCHKLRCYTGRNYQFRAYLATKKVLLPEPPVNAKDISKQ